MADFFLLVKFGKCPLLLVLLASLYFGSSPHSYRNMAGRMDVYWLSLFYSFIVEPFSDEAGHTADTSFTELTQKEHLNTEISYHVWGPHPGQTSGALLSYITWWPPISYRKQFFTQEFTWLIIKFLLLSGISYKVVFTATDTSPSISSFIAVSPIKPHLPASSNNSCQIRWELGPRNDNGISKHALQDKWWLPSIFCLERLPRIPWNERTQLKCHCPLQKTARVPSVQGCQPPFHLLFCF